jgi:hypothetical protein
LVTTWLFFEGSYQTILYDFFKHGLKDN